MKDLILAIDNGTQSVRALVFDLRGNLLARSQVMLEPYFSRRPGWAEQDPEYFWEKLCEACQGLWEIERISGAANQRSGESVSPPGGRAGAPGYADRFSTVGGGELRERIAGVAVTTQRASVINVDRDGKPLRPAIIWLDQRRTEGLKPVGGLWGLAFRASRMTETVAYLQAEAEANWIRTHQPAVWKATHKYLYLSGYHTFRLTGHYRDSIGSQVGYMPFDYKNQRWASKRDWKWQAVPMNRRLLPELVAPGEWLGEVTWQAAEATGIPAGLPVIAAAADKACEVLGSGCLQPHMGCLSYGTTATINTTHRRYLEVIPLIPPYPAAIPEAYSLEVQIFRGFWMVSWFKEEFGQMEQELAAEQGVPPEVLFDRLVEHVPAGSMGLMLQPFWSPGLKVPGPEAKGAIIGFGDIHRRGYLYRAILEGLAYALREGKERTEERSGVEITDLRVAGGGSQSDAAMQITADIFGLPAVRPHVYETSGLGAAIDAAVGLGLCTDFDAAVQAMTRPGRIFEPDPDRHRVYNALYQRVYRQMYARLKPLYEEIRDITGYPPPMGDTDRF